MKKYFFLALLATACSSPATAPPTASAPADPPAAAVPPIDVKNGFRDLHFGDPRSRMPGLEIREVQDGTGVLDYVKKEGTEKLDIGSARVVRIHYGFYKDRLTRVYMEAHGDNTDKLISAVTALYGAPVVQNTVVKTARSLFWTGQKVRAEYFETGKEGKLGYLIIQDVQLVAEATKKPDNAKGAADL